LEEDKQEMEKQKIRDKEEANKREQKVGH